MILLEGGASSAGGTIGGAGGAPGGGGRSQHRRIRADPRASTGATASVAHCVAHSHIGWRKDR